MTAGRLSTADFPGYASPAATDRNKLRSEDRAVHDWYRFVLSFPPHLVQDYLQRFHVGSQDAVLDPFCGTGTTLVECKKSGVPSVGIESNPMAQFASAVKVDWSVCGDRLREYAESVAASVRTTLIEQGMGEWSSLPLFSADDEASCALLKLPGPQANLLLKNSISPLPLHKTLVLLQAIDGHGDLQAQRYGRLALANALVNHVGNLKFGPEVGVGQVKQDAAVVDVWLDVMRRIAADIEAHRGLAAVPAEAIEADAREVSRSLEPAGWSRSYWDSFATDRISVR